MTLETIRDIRQFRGDIRVRSPVVSDPTAGFGESKNGLIITIVQGGSICNYWQCK